MNKRKKGGGGPEYQTDETKDKIRDTINNKIKLGLWLSGWKKGENRSEETKTKMRKKKIGDHSSKIKKIFLNMSEEEKNLRSLKLSNSLKYKKKPTKFIESKSIPIIQYDLEGNFIKEWLSAKIASRELNISDSGINQCLKNKNKTSKGYVWKYK